MKITVGKDHVDIEMDRYAILFYYNDGYINFVEWFRDKHKWNGLFNNNIKIKVVSDNVMETY